ncbi:hypothetical protein [Methylobacterium sp. JK268]
MTTLTHAALPALEMRLREAVDTLIGAAALLVLGLMMRGAPRAVLAAIPGGPGQADLGFGLGEARRGVSR